MSLSEQKEELKSFLLSNQNTGYYNEKWFKNHYTELYDDFLNWNFPVEFKFSQNLFHYLSDDKELKLGHCIVCGMRCKFRCFKRGYALHCSNKCKYNDKESYTQTEECKEKRKQTCLEKYGGIGNASKELLEKQKQTNLERYGVENYTQTEECKEKTKQTNLEKYGAENYTQTNECKEKTKQTCQEKYGVENYAQTDEFKEKAKQTNLDKYGKESYTQTEEYKERSKQTNLERYGKENYSQTEEYRENTKQTNLDKYGMESYTQTEEYKEKTKQTNLERYGVENYAQTNECKEKQKQTCLDKYGVEHYSQTDDFKENFKNSEWVKSIQEKSYQTKKKNHTFNSSSIEKEFDNWLTKNNFNFESQYRSELYPFNCDFYLIDYDLYIEIQGHWTHGQHPYNPDCEADKMIVEEWKSKITKFYKDAINVWTKRDVKKREIAKKNNLNYLEIFSCELGECIKQFNSFLK